VTFSLHAVLLYGFDLRHWKAVLGCWRKALLAKHFWQSTFDKALIAKSLLQTAYCKPLTAKHLSQSAYCKALAATVTVLIRARCMV
jgi:hypothetical protein